MNTAGYSVTRIRPPTQNAVDPNDLLSKLGISRHHEVEDLELVANIAETIPGMISRQTGMMLYTLCLMQETLGDVVEIGSWQGRSASFLARATRRSGNGKFFAIDHFKGNVGKEKAYVVAATDLSDLKQGFITNMARLGLHKTIHLLDCPNEEAAPQFGASSVRMLFIDGDHTQHGVEKDLNLFLPKMAPKGLIVFDDFTPGFPGLIQAVNSFLGSQRCERVMEFANTLVVRLPGEI